MILIALGIALFGIITATATSVLLKPDAAAEAGSALGVSAEPTGPEAMLRALAALVDEQVLTPDEFATAKRRVLARI